MTNFVLTTRRDVLNINGRDTFFWFLVSVSVTNAWILFKESGRAAGYTHVKFTMELAELLKNNYSSRKNRIVQTPPKLALANFDNHSLVHCEKRSRVCKICSKMASSHPWVTRRKRATSVTCVKLVYVAVRALWL